MEIVQEEELQGQIDEYGQERRTTDRCEDCNPVQLVHAEQHASAEARRLAFDSVQCACGIGHRVHQPEHPQVAGHFAAPQTDHREDVLHFSAKQGRGEDVEQKDRDQGRSAIFG